MKKIIYLLVLVFITIEAGEIKILTQKEQSNKWLIEYQLKHPLDINNTRLIYDNQDINHTSIISPHKDLETATLFLIDTSISMNRSYVQGIKGAIKSIFSQKYHWDYWAIAGFDSDMKIIGAYTQTSPDDALNSIKIRGKTTELYRAVLEGIKSLSKRDTKRRYLLLFSDGRYEDQAYSYKDVIQKAKENNVTILSFGYSLGNKRDNISLQNIRRIAEETGGKLWKAKEYTHKLDISYQEELNKYFNNGGLVTFDASILLPNIKGEQSVDFVVQVDQNKTYKTTLSFPVKKILPTPAIEHNQTTSAIIEKPSHLKYYLIGLGLFLLSGLLYIFFRRNTKKDVIEESIDEDIEEEEKIPLAYLETVSGSKIYIFKTQNTIGSLDENDIVLDGDFISRRHAIIEHKDNRFFIIDHNSTNGVKVNHQLITNEEIIDGDTISFGPLDIIFKLVREN